MAFKDTEIYKRTFSNGDFFPIVNTFLSVALYFIVSGILIFLGITSFWFWFGYFSLALLFEVHKAKFFGDYEYLDFLNDVICVLNSRK